MLVLDSSVIIIKTIQIIQIEYNLNVLINLFDAGSFLIESAGVHDFLEITQVRLEPDPGR